MNSPKSLRTQVEEMALVQFERDSASIESLEREVAEARVSRDLNLRNLGAWLKKAKELVDERDSLTREVAALRSVLSEYGSDHSGFVQWHVANEIAKERK